MFKMTEASLV